MGVGNIRYRSLSIGTMLVAGLLLVLNACGDDGDEAASSSTSGDASTGSASTGSASTGSGGSSSGGDVVSNCATACSMLVSCGIKSDEAMCKTGCEQDMTSCDTAQLAAIKTCLDDFTDCAAAMTAKTCVTAVGCATGL